MACALVFEPRRDEGLASERTLPRGAFRPALEQTIELWSKLDDLEQDNRLPGQRAAVDEPRAGDVRMWSRGSGLDAVLSEADMAAGDFVRWTKQTIDLLDQLSLVAQGNVGRDGPAGARVDPPRHRRVLVRCLSRVSAAVGGLSASHRTG